MPPDPLLPLEYRTPQERPVERSLETVGIHFVIGSGASLAVAIAMVMWNPHYYPLACACGGTVVTVIQWLLLALTTVCRRKIFRTSFGERRIRATVITGFVGGILVFLVPFAELLGRNDAITDAQDVTLALLLFAYPVLTSFIVFRPLHGLPNKLDCSRGAPLSDDDVI
jgi:hypothetical protein